MMELQIILQVLLFFIIGMLAGIRLAEHRRKNGGGTPSASHNTGTRPQLLYCTECDRTYRDTSALTPGTVWRSCPNCGGTKFMVW